MLHAKGKATRKGAMMGFVLLEDLTGQIEGLVFPKIYEQYAGELVEDSLVVLTGKLSIREEEEPKILVDSILPLETYIPSGNIPIGQPRIHLPKAQEEGFQQKKDEQRKLYLRCSKEEMGTIEPLLKEHKGEMPVYIHLSQEKKTFLAPESWRCSGSELLQATLAAQLGKENVKVVQG